MSFSKWRDHHGSPCAFKALCHCMYVCIIEKEVVWLGDILWIGSMELSSHRDFILPNVLSANCYLHEWYV